jgi:outer membrane murein-binding lipoprotein Lpp
MLRRGIRAGLLAVLCCIVPGTVVLTHADNTDATSDVETLKKQVQSLQQTVQQLQQAILTMQQEISAGQQRIQQQVEAVRKRQNDAFASQLTSPLDQAIKEIEQEEGRPILASPTKAIWSQPIGAGANIRLIDISADVLFYAGGSNEKDAALSTLQGGAHDPNKRGFTLGQAEFSFSGAVDPYFRAETHVLTSIDPVGGDTIVELEEAFVTTTSLPYNLQLEVGHFLTEFGQINTQHPHAWDWVDQPVINSRLFGGDGMRQTGFRASWLTPTAWFSELHVGMQNANGANMTSFRGGRHGHAGGGEEEEAFEGPQIGGRPESGDNVVEGFGDFVYLTRWNNSIDLTDEITGILGVSSLYGPNATGDDAETWIYGLDMKWRWNPTGNFRGWPFFTWQTEVMQRDFHADRFIGEAEDGDIITLPSRTFKDWGFYTQLLYGFRYGWEAGLRYEYAGGSGHSINGRQNDGFRDDRHRFSPLLAWRPSEFSRIRLQYNFDHASHLRGNAHSVWLGLEWLYGAHAAHNF